MAAKDYVFQKGCRGTIFLAKRNKSNKLMSEDRRPLTESEILGIFEAYLREYLAKNGDDTLVISSNVDGKVVFTATLYN